nr:MAG TPA: hypothetical protein [Caudoviricetes sp.]
MLFVFTNRGYKSQKMPCQKRVLITYFCAKMVFKMVYLDNIIQKLVLKDIFRTFVLSIKAF